MRILLLYILSVLSLTITTHVKAVNDASTNVNYAQIEEETEMRQTTAPTITPSQAREKMLADPSAIILDVRTQQEFDEERIPGAILLPDFEVEARAAEVLPDRDALILVYCRSGRRSKIAADLLVSMGYTNVYDFGGIISWPYERE